MYNILTCNDAQ